MFNQIENTKKLFLDILESLENIDIAKGAQVQLMNRLVVNMKEAGIPAKIAELGAASINSRTSLPWEGNEEFYYRVAQVYAGVAIKYWAYLENNYEYPDGMFIKMCESLNFEFNID